MEQQKTTVPAWMDSRPLEPLPAGRNPWRKDFLDKTLHTIRRRMQQERLVGMAPQSFLVSLNTPVKTLCTLLLLVSTGMTHSLLYLIFIQILLLLGSRMTGLKLTSFLCRTYIPVFFFTVIALIPSIFSWVTPGTPLYIIYTDGPPWGLHWLPTTFYISVQGVTTMAFVFLRSLNSVGIAVLFLRVTPWQQFTRSLTKWGIPSLIVMMLDITYRYVYLFMPLLEEYFLGRRSRMTGRASYNGTLRWIGASVADLARVTDSYATDIYEALQSRGYTGEYRMPMAWHWGWREISTTLIVVILFVVGGLGWHHLFLP